MTPIAHSRFRRALVSVCVPASCLFLLAFGATPDLPAMSALQRQGPPSLEGVPRLGHVFLIIGENTTYDHVTSTNMPYLMQTMRPQAAWFTQYYGATHWSQANYVALVTGQFTDCEQSDYGAACHQDVENLFHQLDQSRLTWKTWLEAGTARCDTGSGGTCTSDTPCPLTGFYTTGNPAILFDNIEGPGGVWSATNPSQECLQNDVPAGDDKDPMGFFHQALGSGNLANFNLVIPNGCEDGEGNCAPINNRYTQFDAFLAREVPLIMASPGFGTNDLIIVVYDEDERAGKNGLGQGGHTVCAIVGPAIVPGEYNDTTYHYTLLRTIEDGFGISNYLGHAAEVPPLTSIWSAHPH
jgi:hypothetical protein